MDSETGAYILNELCLPTGTALEGLIVGVAKPAGITSFGVVSRIRRSSRIQRVGHAGTLDPFAEGVLVVGIGRIATRQLGDIMRFDKEYVADVVLGVTTDTGDPTGRITQKSDLPSPDADAIREVLGRFQGESEQVPHAFSAIKFGGKPSYKMARKGISTERIARPVVIHEIELTGMLPNGFSLRVVCGHGVYIRVLAEDIGNLLGMGGHLGRLVRTRIGEYTLAEAYILDELLSQLESRVFAA